MKMNKELDELEDNNEKSLIKNILKFEHDKSVEDVMVPRAEIICNRKKSISINRNFI